MREVLLGATAMGCVCVAMFFFRFWRRSGDTLHMLFAASFGLQAGQRLMVAAFEVPGEASPVLYLPRLLAYLLIIAAIVGKNLGRPGRPASDAPRDASRDETAD